MLSVSTAAVADDGSQPTKIEQVVVTAQKEDAYAGDLTGQTTKLGDITRQSPLPDPFTTARLKANVVSTEGLATAYPVE